MNDIGDDIFKVIYGHDESAFWRLRMCKDESYWLDTLSVSNSSSRNWNIWFIATIASLNSVAKTFAKIAKTFVRLSTTIIATRRRPVLILHLEAKYAKNKLQKWNLREKLGKEHLDWKSQPWRKVNGQCQRSVKVNSQIPKVKGWRQRLTQAGDVSNGAARADVDDVSKRVERVDGAWRRVGARDLKSRRVGRVINRTETLGGAWGRVRSPTALWLSRFCRLAHDHLCGTFKNVIWAMFVAVMQTAVVCAVWNSLTTAAAGPEPKDDGWVTSEVQRRKAAAVVVMADEMLKKESH